MFKLLKSIMNAIFFSTLVLGAPEGDENVVKFGGIEIDTTGFTPEQVENLGKAKDSYNNSASEVGKFKEKATKWDKHEADILKNPDKTKKDVPKDIDAIIDARIREKMGRLDDVQKTMMEHNINVQMETVKTRITTDYSSLGKDTVAQVIKEADELFKGLELDQKNPQSYENYIKANLAEKARDNLGTLEVGKAKELIKGDPKALKALFDEYISDNNLDINMGFEGITSNEEFTTRMGELQTNFKKAKTSQDRAKYATQIQNLDSQGSKFGFKIS